MNARIGHPAPDWVDAESAMNAAIALVQGDESSMTWGKCLAHAQAVLEHYSDLVTYETGVTVSEAYHEHVLMAEMTLACAASDFGMEDAGNRRNAAVLAACAHGMCGNSDRAGAVIEGHRLMDMKLSPAELTVLTASCPEVWKYTHMGFRSQSSMQTCVRFIRDYMIDGDRKWLEHALYAINEALESNLDAWSAYLLRFGRVCLMRHIAITNRSIVE